MSKEILSEKKEKRKQQLKQCYVYCTKNAFLQGNKNNLHLYIHTHTNIHVNKPVDNSYCLLEKQI